MGDVTVTLSVFVHRHWPQHVFSSDCTGSPCKLVTHTRRGDVLLVVRVCCDGSQFIRAGRHFLNERRAIKKKQSIAIVLFLV